MSHFEKVEKFPDDPIFSLPLLFQKDTHLNKVNLGIGVYRDEENMPYVFQSVQQAEKVLFEKKCNKEYLPIEGNRQFLTRIEELVFETRFTNLVSFQTVGGTSALYIGGKFLSYNKLRNIYLPEETWPNHQLIFQHAGCELKSYPYYDVNTHSVNFTGILQAVEKMPPQSVMLLHACCHNPTGMDLTFDQLKELSKALKRKKIVPFFDLAYHGLGSSLHDDVKGVQQFFDDGHEMLIAYSCAKNFGLYGERVGALIVVGEDEKILQNVNSQIKQLIRSSYSNPPIHGASIVVTLLENAQLRTLWEKELYVMRERLMRMRVALAERTQGHFSFLKNQNGMFSYTGLNLEQVTKLRQEFGIYLVSNGRINVAGLNETNLDYVAQSLLKALS